MKNALSIIAVTVLLAGVSGCAPMGAVPSNNTAPVTGEIVLSEAIPSINQAGGGAAVAIGAAVVGALIPGPWGSVAQVATGQAGSAAMSGATGSMRYHVRLPDGTIKTINQAQAAALPAGTAVDILTLSDGSQRVVPSRVAAVQG